MKALLGRKLGMTQLFDENGAIQRVTVVEAGPCIITHIKTGTKDGYDAIQLGLGEAKSPTKAEAGHATHNKVTPKTLREIRTSADEGSDDQFKPKVGSELKVDIFEVGDPVQVTGTSKGKGFAGTIKRHNFSTGPKTHGSRNYRQPGSIGAGYPQHVQKGMKMAGRMGSDQVTVKGLKIVKVDAAKNILAISGAIPGPNRSLVVIRGQA